MAKRKKHKWVKWYIKAITPPYSLKDLIPILASVILIVILIFILNPVRAQVINNTPLLMPKITIGNEIPLVIPFTHAEQRSVHLFWSHSSDNTATIGYRIYKNGQKLGESFQPRYDDFNTVGEMFYEIEAYDQAGNVSSKSTTTRIYLPEEWCNCADTDDAVIAGFISDAAGKPLSAPLAFTISSKKINIRKTTYTSNSSTNGQYVNVFKNVTSEGVYDVNLTSNGYVSQIKQINLKSGLSIHTDWQLIPQQSKGRR